MLDNVQKEINGFYSRYASKEGVSLSKAKKRVKQLDIEAYERKAKKYVAEKTFTPEANEEMRLYNATMKINRLEMLKANIGLETVSGFNDLQKYFDTTLTDRTLSEFKRQAGILGKTVQDNQKLAHSIVNGSFHNARFSDRIWMYQAQLKDELDNQLQIGLIQGRNPRQLVTHVSKVFGARRSDAERLMQTELARVQTEAQKQSYERNGYDKYVFIAEPTACPVCQALDDKVFEVGKMMPGTNASPMHPNCRCSTAAYADREALEARLAEIEAKEHKIQLKGVVKSSSMAERSERIEWAPKDKKITHEEYKDIMEYARSKRIDLSGFKRYDGSSEIIRRLLDDADFVASKYPEIKSGKKHLTIALDDTMEDYDFAITRGHIVSINANAFRNEEILNEEYSKLEKEGWFVKGTDYHSIIMHEIGHVVSNSKGIDGLKVATKITGLGRKETMQYIGENLSEYAGEFKDGSEIISEVFSDFFGSKNPSSFSLKFIEECGKVKEKRT